jgi:hypothetical protein
MIPFLSLPPLCSLPESRRITAAPIPGNNTAVTVLPPLPPHEMSPQRHWSLSGTGVNPPEPSEIRFFFSWTSSHANPQVAEEALTPGWHIGNSWNTNLGFRRVTTHKTCAALSAASEPQTVSSRFSSRANCSISPDPQTLSPRESPPRLSFILHDSSKTDYSTAPALWS